MVIQYNGLISFERGLQLQSDAVDYLNRHERPVCLGCEHYPVITLGKRSQNSEILASRFDIQEKGFDIVSTDRGGHATLHSPGQLVIYPILPLRQYGISVREYVNCLEKATISWLKSLGVEATRGEETGVFTDVGKIAFIGIRVEKGISRHGISINVSNDLDLFQWIEACGMRRRPLDSMAQRGVYLTPEEAFRAWVDYFIHDLIELRSQTPSALA